MDLGWLPGHVVAQAASDVDLEDAFSRSLEPRDWLVAGIILVVAIAVGRVVQSIIARVLTRDEADDEITHFAAVAVRNLIILAGIVYAMTVLGVRMGPLLGAIGLGGLAIAFAAQSILANFFASIVLRTRRPFRRGDQVVFGDQEGTVEDVNFRTVSVRTFDGERALVPCADVLSSPIVNLTARGKRRTTLMVSVAYEADLAEAIEVLEAALLDVDGVLATPRPRAFVEEMADSGINLALQFWHSPEMAQMWEVRSSVAIAAKVALEGADIEIPFPQQVVRFRPADDET